MPTVIEFLLDHSVCLERLLLLAETLAAITVGVGIIWESPKPTILWEAPTYKRDLTKLAHRLVIWGIAFETLFSVSLFVLDEGVSNRQQDKIVALERRALPRDITDEDAAKIVEAIRVVPEKFDLLVYQDEEPLNVMHRLCKILTDAHWEPVNFDGAGFGFSTPDCPVFGSWSGSGVEVVYGAADAAALHFSAERVAKALVAAGIAADSKPVPSTIDNNAGVIHILIGRKK